MKSKGKNIFDINWRSYHNISIKKWKEQMAFLYKVNNTKKREDNILKVLYTPLES